MSNHHFYSRRTYETEKRAHWNAGSGFWQLDPWVDSFHLNHGERIATDIGGIYVARQLRDGFCDKGATIGVQEAIREAWPRSCDPEQRPNACWTLGNDLYVSENNLRVDEQSQMTQVDGGQHSYNCRFRSVPDEEYLCRYVDTDFWADHGMADEGYALHVDPFGRETQTTPPLPPEEMWRREELTPVGDPFLSLTHGNKNKFDIWLSGFSSYETEMGRWEPMSVKRQIRYGGGNWYFESTLQVCERSPAKCVWYENGLPQ